MKYQWVAGKYDRYGAQRGYHLIIKDGKAAFAGRDGSGDYRNSGYSAANVSDGNWHHLAGVCDGRTWTIYVDGILQNSITTNYSQTSLTNTAPLAVGKYFLYDDEYYEGQIDEVRIWKKALTRDEIRQQMCSKLSSFPADLVAYFNFDASGTATVKDLSSQRLDGTLQQLNPTVAWVTSGAPIGDKSVYRYTDGRASQWDASFEMVTDRANFSVINVDPGVDGFHLYSIQSPPASTNGIGDAREVQEYYGLFKAGAPSKKYKVYFKQYGMDCGGLLYRRQDNTKTNWGQVADTTASLVMLYNTSANYGEYAGTGKAAPAVAISGPESMCAGTTANLSVQQNTGETVRWSTGESSANITVTTEGTYWVEVTTASGCTVRDEITIALTKEPTFSFPTEVPICNNEAAVLDATTEGATYRWSNGQTSPSIAVTAPGTYAVTISLNGCSYTRDIVASDDECPVIPNIITPNGDGKNDSFVLHGVAPNSMELAVFNRWGKVVYQSDKYSNEWGATGMAAGTYYYQLKSSRSGRVYKGWVEVVK
ncbi:gliding motility-associated C-terminal domain-containing protein [Pontibacter akesuensis]|uniref:Gliding motility-associated C-terminal domain-containing protein n=2 Tax=Pontibacter akesuensis TaxID=388950 RepID=A0A1I7FMV8_9BACT|nr:gliding motility-associated C-terminal domain-containing protein [Pontibacter akesuensis]